MLENHVEVKVSYHVGKPLDMANKVMTLHIPIGCVYYKKIVFKSVKP